MCEFCEKGKIIKAEYKGAGISTAKNIIDSLFGAIHKDSFKIAHIERGIMWVDNSSGEYAELGFDIKYCPFCGAQMEGEKNEVSS